MLEGNFLKLKRFRVDSLGKLINDKEQKCDIIWATILKSIELYYCILFVAGPVRIEGRPASFTRTF